MFDISKTKADYAFVPLPKAQKKGPKISGNLTKRQKDRKTERQKDRKVPK